MARETFVVSAPRYGSTIGALFYQLGYACLYFWWFIVNESIGCFYLTLEENNNNRLLDRRYAKGFLYGLIAFWCIPVGLYGLAVWIFACTFFDQKFYSFLHYRKDILAKPSARPKVMTLTSSNVLLAAEGLSRYNNCKDARNRADQIGRRIADQLPIPAVNLADQTSQSGVIFDKFPQTDILCLQEVWERYHAATLIESLSEKYEYFLYDVGNYSWNTNKCLLGSGLFVASRYRIMAADFHVFSFRTKFAKYVSYGVLCFSVELYRGRDQLRRVGYMANVHLQAYQGTDPVLYNQLTEILCFTSRFKERTKKPADVIAFDVICGDLNFDNMSPGDVKLNQHPIFHLYRDPAMVRPGTDKPWAIGTELRQPTIHNDEIQEPKHFAAKLADNSERRKYILDADVQVQTPLLASVLPKPNPDGSIPSTPSGGMRRIDRFLVRNGQPPTIGYGFSSVLSGLTDHLPVTMTLNLSRMYMESGMSEQVICNGKFF